MAYRALKERAEGSGEAVMDDTLELEILGTALDIIERQNSREKKIAALRSFVRGMDGLLPLQSDREILEMP
jgi:hypothetical protein